MSFKQLNIIEPILQALSTEGYTTPTPIQKQAIPVILEGKDLLGCAQTGTGKTAAFAIPTIQLLHSRAPKAKGVRALILTPTRELAIQIGESFDAYAKHTKIKHTVIFGGVSQHAQTTALARGVDALIATPGRFLDLLNQGYIRLNTIEIFILDEADKMLDMGFIHDIKKIVALLPSKRQSLFFSATMPAEIVKLSDAILKSMVKVEVARVSSTADKVEQGVYFVEKKDKKSLLIQLVNEKSMSTALVFTRTKHGADRLSKDLNRAGIQSEAIHGNKSQNARQRALANFKSKNIQVLVATDIAARGIDVEELPYVINFDLPNEPETYVHRIGRTGRAGASGIALSFCDMEERGYLKDINKLIVSSIPVVDGHDFISNAFNSDAGLQTNTEKRSAKPFFKKSTSSFTDQRPRRPRR